MLELLHRYEDLLGNIASDDGQSEDKTSNRHLCWMLQRISKMKNTDPKLHRWLGFVQGVMAVRGLIDVDEERDLTRHIFN